MAKKHLIIGCGSAALAALGKIRSISSDDEIKVVSMEPYLPYSPASLPYLLAGKLKESDIWIKDEKYFRRQEATFLPGKEVVRLLPDRRQVIYSDGDAENYDTLLIASGAKPTKPPIPGVDEVDFLGFHTLSDYYRLEGMLKGEQDLAILGAGMVAMELASALAERGSKVKVIGRGRPLRLYFDEQAGAYISDIFASNGVQIATGRRITEIKKNGHGVNVYCADGEIFEAELLIRCLGVEPRVSFLEGSGVRLDRGVIVDSRMRTNVECIYAAGDVAQASDFFYHRPSISAIVPSAMEQGKVAGANMAGEETEYPGWVSMNVFNFFGNIACSIGLPMLSGEDKEVLEKQDEHQRRFQRLVFEGGHLIGSVFINVEVNPGVIGYLIKNRIDVGDYKQLLLQEAKETSLWLMLEAERRQAGLTRG